jgi:hypothetical protein
MTESVAGFGAMASSLGLSGVGKGRLLFARVKERAGFGTTTTTTTSITTTTTTTNTTAAVSTSPSMAFSSPSASSPAVTARGSLKATKTKKLVF